MTAKLYGEFGNPARLMQIRTCPLPADKPLDVVVKELKEIAESIFERRITVVVIK